MYYEVVEPSAIYEFVDGEVLALNLMTGIYVQMKQLSAELFHALATGTSTEAIVNAAQTAGYSDAQITEFDSHYSNWVALGLLRSDQDTGRPKSESFALTPSLQFVEEKWDTTNAHSARRSTTAKSLSATG